MFLTVIRCAYYISSDSKIIIIHFFVRYLADNQFSGEIPESIWQMSSLTYLYELFLAVLLCIYPYLRAQHARPTPDAYSLVTYIGNSHAHVPGISVHKARTLSEPNRAVDMGSFNKGYG